MTRAAALGAARDGTSSGPDCYDGQYALPRETGVST